METRCLTFQIVSSDEEVPDRYAREALGYVQSFVANDPNQQVLTSEMKGRRLLRGSEWKFIRHPFVDDVAARASEFVDEEAESSSRSESIEVAETSTESSTCNSGTGGGEESGGPESGSLEVDDGPVSLLDL